MLIREVFDANCRVYGARKIWRGDFTGRGHQVARRTLRLMRELGIRRRGPRAEGPTTIADPAAERVPDLVQRDFVVDTFSRRSWSAARAADPCARVWVR